MASIPKNILVLATWQNDGLETLTGVHLISSETGETLDWMTVVPERVLLKYLSHLKILLESRNSLIQCGTPFSRESLVRMIVKHIKAYLEEEGTLPKLQEGKLIFRSTNNYFGGLELEQKSWGVDGYFYSYDSSGRAKVRFITPNKANLEECYQEALSELAH